MGDPQSETLLRSAIGEDLVQAVVMVRAGRSRARSSSFGPFKHPPRELNSSRLLGVALLAQDKVQPAIETLERTVTALRILAGVDGSCASPARRGTL